MQLSVLPILYASKCERKLFELFNYTHLITCTTNYSLSELECALVSKCWNLAVYVFDVG